MKVVECMLGIPARKTFKGEKQFSFEMDEMCENDRHSKQNEGRTAFPDTMGTMVCWVVEFLTGEYKISDIFAQKSTSSKEILIFCK